MAEKLDSQDHSALAIMKRLSILCVEGDAQVRHQLADFLGQRFGQVLLAVDGRDGLRQFQQADPKPNLVITDIVMPVMDGLTMTRLLHELDPQLPVLVTTAHEESDYLIEAINLDVERFFIKPLDTNQLHRYLVRCAQQFDAHQSILNTRQQLADNEARYRAVFWTAMDAFCLFDWQQQRIIEVNRYFQTLYLWPSQDIENQPLTTLFPHQDDGQLTGLLEQAIAADEPLILTHCDRNGTWAPVQMMVGRFEIAEKTLGLMVSRDARSLVDNLEQQDTLIDALEVTVAALEEMFDDAPDGPLQLSG